MSNSSNPQAVAIIGVAFRFPGDMSDEQSFWSALTEGRDLVTSVGSERWAVKEMTHPKRSEPGRSITFSAGVLSRIEEFDADFFGISAREAAQLDPQQRMLLELAWEAMENGNIPPSRLAGSKTAVFVGMSANGYGMRMVDDLGQASAHTATGNSFSIASNRISYVFDLRGPSMTLDTACSSSLVALHQACSSLLSGEADTAFAGGVNLLVHPAEFISFTKASMLSANGRCKTFDASGDGYVRSEGGAVFLLKRLDRALSDGDHIEAVILASGINADGARKTGITIPSSDGQAELMQSVLQRGGVAPSDIDYLEAHGTGTIVGDPIETAAIGRVYGKARAADNPLPIGSVKSNIGHLEPVSGMAGLVKALLMLKHRSMPPSIHVQTLNPHIDFAGLNVEVVQSLRSFPKKRQLTIGINSFGFGGANAHVIVREYRPSQPAAVGKVRQNKAHPPLLLSAHTPDALRAMAGQYAERLSEATTDYYDLAYAAAFCRDALEERLAVVAVDREGVRQALEAFAHGENPASVTCETALREPGGIAFVYSGNGAQWQGMALRLQAESPRFAALLAELEAPIQSEAGFSIAAELKLDAAATRIDDTTVAQPLLFAIQVALTRLLQEDGLTPDAVTGHSVGEVAAAWAAGGLDLPSAIRVICARSRAQGQTRGTGRMAAVGMSRQEAEALLGESQCTTVEIAGFNSPNQLTLSGELSALEGLRRPIKQRGRVFRLLDLDYAFHSRAMEPIRPMLLASLNDLAPQATRLPFVSAVEGAELAGNALDATYWWRNIREPVRFSDAIQALAEKGCRIFIEIGPNAILQRYIDESLQKSGVDARTLASLQRDDDGIEKIARLTTRIGLLNGGLRDARRFPRPGRPCRLPNYPWQRERHWFEAASSQPQYMLRRSHPLLGWRLSSAPCSWENVLDPATLPWLNDHKVGGALVLPGSAYVEIALAAAREYYQTEAIAIEQIEIVSPMVFDGEHGRSTRVDVYQRDGSIQILSRQRLSGDEWKLHATGRLLGEPSVLPASRIPGVRNGQVALDHEQHYRRAQACSLDFGPTFRGLVHAEVKGDYLSGLLESTVVDDDGEYSLHPALLDACLQSMLSLFADEYDPGSGTIRLPVKVGRVIVHGKGRLASFRVHLIRRNDHSHVADFELFDPEGQLLASLDGFRFRAVPVSHRERGEPSAWRTLPQLLAPLPSEGSLPRAPLKLLSQSLSDWFDLQEVDLQRRSVLKEILPLLEALAIAFARDGFERLRVRDSDWLAAAVAAPESQNAYFQWLISLLRAEGLLGEGGGQGSIVGDIPSPEEIWRGILRDYPACLPELVRIGRVGRRLPEILCGEEDASRMLQDLHHSYPCETLYANSPLYHGVSLAVRQAIAQFTTSWPAQRRVRVIELTTAQTGLARHLAELPIADRLDYVLQTSDEVLADRIKAELQDLSFASVEFVEAESLASAESTRSFDVVVVSHQLHRMSNPGAALSWVRDHLVPGGLLLVAERHADLSADFVEGAIDSWWHGGSDKPVSSLQSPEVWRELLAIAGFHDASIFVEPASDRLSEGAYLLLATHENESPAVNASQATWLLLAESVAEADQLRRELEVFGQSVQVLAGDVYASASSSLASAKQALLDVREQFGSLEHVAGVFVRPAADLTEIDPNGSLALCQQWLVWTQALMAQETSPRLTIVASGGALASGLPDGHTPDARHAALWGFGRVVMNEAPALECRLVDVAVDASGAWHVKQLVETLVCNADQSEVILMPGARYSLCIERQPTTETITQSRHYKLGIDAPGQLRNLVWENDNAKTLEKGEVEVEPIAMGLNFRDVMYTLGMLPDEAIENGLSGASIGLEFAGKVSRVGEGVLEFGVGDEVIGCGAACFSSHVVVRASSLSQKPQSWSFAAAATVPTAFFTAYYSLKHLADVQPGECVLIHGAAGAVGIAAVQICQHLGAEIFATAGSDEKRDFVTLLGAHHVLDSRSLAFPDEIMALTNGRGVDVILNSLAGEAVRRNLDILRPFGRFLELGKRDFFENTPLGLRPFRNNISYFGIDADQLMIERPALNERLFSELMELFHSGALSPLPFRVFPSARAQDAFRYMQQSRHIGKIVLERNTGGMFIKSKNQPPERMRFDAHGCYLVTGGLTGFGLESARWLAERGAGHLALVSRRGMDTSDAAKAVTELEALGATVSVHSADVCDRAAMAGVLAEIDARHIPLKGILHAAMVLDDAVLGNLTIERMTKAMAPKVLGACHLHALSLGRPLDHFILYSSITTYLGNAGQANYVAANAFLEGLAAMRQRQGLPATCIGWGAIDDVGYLAQNKAVKEGVSVRLGAMPQSASKTLTALDRWLSVPTENLAVADFDWPTMARLMPSAKSPRFASLRRTAGSGGQAEAHTEDLSALLEGKTSDEALEIVRSTITQELAQILSVSPEKIDGKRPLHDLGMDSLMAVELALALERRCNIQLPAMMLSEKPTIERLALRILDKLTGEPAESAPMDELTSIAANMAELHGEDIAHEELKETAENMQKLVTSSKDDEEQAA